MLRPELDYWPCGNHYFDSDGIEQVCDLPDDHQ